MAEFHCWSCRYVGTADEFVGHRCGRVTCARCGINYPTASFASHGCIAELMSSTDVDTGRPVPFLSAGPRGSSPRAARANPYPPKPSLTPKFAARNPGLTEVSRPELPPAN